MSLPFLTMAAGCHADAGFEVTAADRGVCAALPWTYVL